MASKTKAKAKKKPAKLEAQNSGSRREAGSNSKSRSKRSTKSNNSRGKTTNSSPAKKPARSSSRSGKSRRTGGSTRSGTQGKSPAPGRKSATSAASAQASKSRTSAKGRSSVPEEQIEKVLKRCVRCDRFIEPNDNGKLPAPCQYCGAPVCGGNCRIVHENVDCEDPHAPRVLQQRKCGTCGRNTTNLTTCCYVVKKKEVPPGHPASEGFVYCGKDVCEYCKGANMNTGHEMEHGTMCAEHTKKTKRWTW